MVLPHVLWLVAPSFHSWRRLGWPTVTQLPYTSETAQQLTGATLQRWLCEREIRCASA